MENQSELSSRKLPAATNNSSINSLRFSTSSNYSLASTRSSWKPIVSVFFQLLAFPSEPVLQHFRFGPYCRLLDIQSFECDLFSCESRLFNYCEISPELRLATNGISIFMNIQNELVHSRVPSFSVYLFGAESFAFTGLQWHEYFHYTQNYLNFPPSIANH